jgi:hypothetical protein
MATKGKNGSGLHHCIGKKTLTETKSAAADGKVYPHKFVNY